MKSPLSLLLLSLLMIPFGCTPEDAAPIHGVPLYQVNHQRLFDEHGRAEIASSELPFLRAGIIWDAPAATLIEGRLGLVTGQWTRWKRLQSRWSEGVHHTGYFDAPTGQRARRLELRLVAGPAPAHLIARGIVRLGEPLRAVLDGARSNAIGSRTYALGSGDFPGLHLRSEWGARPPNCTYTNHSPNKITIHHTAGVAATATTAPAALRQIQRDHQDTNGWCDIGYHFIVDADGGVWQGRPHTVVGAHTASNNTNNVGICLMGHFNASQPTSAQLNAAAAVVDWLHQTYGIPKTSTYVKGHRDYKATDCPGHLLYARLSEVLEGTTAPPTCTPTGPEICDGKDNDCNGYVDDGNPGGGAYCTVLGKTGPCATGITSCRDGVPVCESTYTPRSESCNKVDDDCNGLIDDVPGGCGTDCTPQPEVCDGEDNDCNGHVDDVVGGCDDTPGCVPSGPEICDGLDNDCNGFPDDGNPEGGQRCTFYLASTPFEGVMMCLSGQLVCQANDPGTSSFTDSSTHYRGTGCSAAVGDAARTFPAFTLLLLVIFGIPRRRKRRNCS